MMVMGRRMYLPGDKVLKEEEEFTPNFYI